MIERKIRQCYQVQIYLDGKFLIKEKIMNNKILPEIVAPLQAGILAFVSITMTDVDIMLTIITKIATLISIGFVCAYHYTKTKRIKNTTKKENENI